MLSFGECCVETSAKNNLGVQDDVSLLPEQFLRKRHEQKGPLKLHFCSLHKLKLEDITMIMISCCTMVRQ